MSWHATKFGERGVGFDYVVSYDDVRYSLADLDAAMVAVNTMYPRSVWKHDEGRRTVYYRITDKARFIDFYEWLLANASAMPYGNYEVPHRVKTNETIRLRGFPVRP